MRHSRSALTVTAALCVALAPCGVNAQDTNMKRAYEAAQSAEAFKRQGDLDSAESMFRITMQYAPDTSNIHREAEDEVAYYIPLMRVQRLLWEGKTKAAEMELMRLQLQFDDQPVRRQEVNRILYGLQTATLDSGNPDENSVDERLMMDKTRLAMENYFRGNQHYPRDRAELGEALTFDRPPLALFDIQYYASDGAGYLLILSGKQDASHVLTLQNTGLMH